MAENVILLSLPGLRERDVMVMRNLRELCAGGEIATLTPSFPCLTCPVQAGMTTGAAARDHGVVANGFFWRERGEVEMWTAPATCIERLRIWDVLHQRDPELTSALWFPLHSKQATADYVCTPAPVHNPDGSESLWCYTKPTELYGTLRDRLDHFPLHHFWGPLADIRASDWIIDSALYAAKQFRPRFFYIYLPHLDYAAQRSGPESTAADEAVATLDASLGRLAEGMRAAYGEDLLWLVAGEYAITAVRRVVYPNRVLREMGLLAVRETDEGEWLDAAGSAAFALVDHQMAHVFVRDGDEATARRVAERLSEEKGVAEVLVGPERARYELDHARSGEVILVCRPDAWAAYYYWLEDDAAPPFARTVDIHRKPGYDPVELFIEPEAKAIPLDATLVRGSHGAPAHDRAQKTVLLASQPSLFPGPDVRDRDVFSVVLDQFSP